MTVLEDFFSSQKSEEKQLVKESVASASDKEPGKSVAISHPGNYLCKVSTVGYIDKATDSIRTFPEAYIATTKSLNLNVRLETIEATPEVPVGSSVFMNITLLPVPQTKENIDKVMKFTKPRIVALTGEKEINITPEWVEEFLLPKFERDGAKVTMVKDHKMKQNVMIIVDEVVRNDKRRMEVKSVFIPQPGDKSTSLKINSLTHVNSASANEFANSINNDSDSVDVPNVPEIEDV